MYKLFVFFTLISITSFAPNSIITNVSVEEILPERKLLELEIEGVYSYGYNESYLIQLSKKDANDNWILPMVIGGCEAKAVARNINDIGFSRPLTYDLFNSVFEKTSIKLKHVVITKLEKGVFYAVLVLDDNGKTIEIDARPSDSMNIAMKSGVSIYATEEVWNEVKEEVPEKDDD